MRCTLSEKAHEIIKAEIIRCTLEPGQQVAQRHLVERLGLGTTPVREALQRLAQEGLVQTIPRFGYVVSPITLADVQEIYELRTILEAAAVRLAAERGSADQLERIAQDARFTYVYKDRTSYSEFLARNTSFHRSIALLADNGRLAEQISRLLDEMTRIFHLGLDLRDSAEEMRDEHLALAQAVCNRDPDRAEQIVGEQITRSRDRVLEALTSRPAPATHSGPGTRPLGRAIQLRPTGLS
jgi:DNA-binding GntR family transcriptional regulator